MMRGACAFAELTEIGILEWSGFGSAHDASGGSKLGPIGCLGSVRIGFTGSSCFIISFEDSIQLNIESGFHSNES